MNIPHPTAYFQNIELNRGQTIVIATGPGDLGGSATGFPPDDEALLLAAYSSTAGLGIIDLTFRYVWVNEQLARKHNRPASAHVGTTVREILGALADLKEPHLRHVMQTGQPVLNVDISGELAGGGPVFWR